MAPVVWDTFEDVKFYRARYSPDSQLKILNLRGVLTNNVGEADDVGLEVNIF
jgi:hypothetical protein